MTNTIEQPKAKKLDKKGGTILAFTLILSIVFFIIGGTYIKRQNEDDRYPSSGTYSATLAWNDWNNYYESVGTQYKFNFYSSNHSIAYFFVEDGETPRLQTSYGGYIDLYEYSGSTSYSGFYYDNCYYAYLDTHTNYQLNVKSNNSNFRIALSSYAP